MRSDACFLRSTCPISPLGVLMAEAQTRGGRWILAAVVVGVVVGAALAVQASPASALPAGYACNKENDGCIAGSQVYCSYDCNPDKGCTCDASS